ncbi:MAG: phosphodiester glycosidase family protein, partial [Solimonas sp.]
MRITRNPPRAKTALASLLVLLLAACGGGGGNDSNGSGDASAVSELPAAALPLGRASLAEARETCSVVPGVWLTRIIRGTPDRAPLPLPCSVTAQSNPSGGGGDGPKPGGPFAVHVLEIDPKVFHGGLESVLGRDQIIGKETPSAMAARRNAVAAVNGGYFVVGEGDDQANGDGQAGDPAGIFMLDGQLVSEAAAGRTAIVWSAPDAGSVHFPIVDTQLSADFGGGQSLPLDGINRIPGVIRMCGGVGDQPTSAPVHDLSCHDDDELIAFQPIWGGPTPAGDGVEAVIENGKVTMQCPRGGAIPANGWVLAATGNSAADLASLAAVGQGVTLKTAATDKGAPMAIAAGTAITGGGPQLIRDGAAAVRIDEEGFRYLANPVQELYLLQYVYSGQPRTLAAKTASGRLLFVVVDGRRNDWSVGLSFNEAARLLLALGGEDGLNLDGGSSSSMVVNG